MTDHRFSKVGAGNHTNSLSAIQTSGIAKMSGLRHVHKIPTIRGTDIIRDPRLNKVVYVELIFQRQLRGRPYALERTSFLPVRVFHYHLLLMPNVMLSDCRIFYFAQLWLFVT